MDTDEILRWNTGPRLTVDLNTGQWQFTGPYPESLEQVQQWVDNVNRAMNQVFQPKNSGSKKD